MNKLPDNCHISLRKLVEMVRGDKGTMAKMLADAGVEYQKEGKTHFYPLEKATLAHADWLREKDDGESEMDRKLREDRLFTRSKRLAHDGELVDAAEAERVGAVMAATVSNTIDSWGLSRKKRNDLMSRIDEAMEKAWSGNFGDEDEEEEDD